MHYQRLIIIKELNSIIENRPWRLPRVTYGVIEHNIIAASTDHIPMRYNDGTVFNGITINNDGFLKFIPCENILSFEARDNIIEMIFDSLWKKLSKYLCSFLYDYEDEYMVDHKFNEVTLLIKHCCREWFIYFFNDNEELMSFYRNRLIRWSTGELDGVDSGITVSVDPMKVDYKHYIDIVTHKLDVYYPQTLGKNKELGKLIDTEYYSLSIRKDESENIIMNAICEYIKDMFATVIKFEDFIHLNFPPSTDQSVLLDVIKTCKLNDAASKSVNTYSLAFDDSISYKYFKIILT